MRRKIRLLLSGATSLFCESFTGGAACERGELASAMTSATKQRFKSLPDAVRPLESHGSPDLTYCRHRTETRTSLSVGLRFPSLDLRPPGRPLPPRLQPPRAAHRVITSSFTLNSAPASHSQRASSRISGARR